MTKKEVREALEKQLQLLSECSHAEPRCSVDELARAADAMCNLVNYMAIVGYGQD